MLQKTVSFPLGTIVATPGALCVLTREEIATALHRHRSGDWGELDPEDRRANDQALIEGSRLLSAYHSRFGKKFWVITESDRSVTTILLPSEY